MPYRHTFYPTFPISHHRPSRLLLTPLPPPPPCSHNSHFNREFIEKLLPTFSKVNPQLETLIVLRRGHHPFMVGEFINGTSRSVDMRNQNPNQIMRQARYLRDALGRKTSKRVKERVLSKLPSIQGTWTAELQDSLKR
jgi:hypothetical protein